MITEDYVSREVAKLLKEKGFNESGHYEYHDKLSKPHFHKKSHNFNGDEYANCGTKWYSAPTHQMAMKWLREVYGLSVEIFSIKGTSNVCPVFWKGNVVKLLTQDRVFSGELVGSYEEAVEAALEYSLENLI